MKVKVLKVLMLSVGAILLAASCSATTKNNGENKKEKIENMKTDGKKLVVFFSHTGENYNVGYIEKGNTHVIADMIAEATGADTFEIKPVKEYPKVYDECIEVAKREKQADARPAIKDDIAIEDYDVILLGYPNWWGEVPMCVYTFIEGHDWTGKTVIPFITHEGSGMGGTDRKIASACKGAEVAVGKGLAMQGKVAQENREQARKSVENWLNNLKISK
ncbi:MAG: flavodoxin [Muribaculaceae bacterium]|nr:flavodoxin [Muribaculaceae bacterium]